MGRIQRYFTMLNKTQFTLNKLEKELAFQKDRRLDADDGRDNFHHKCTRYQDLVFGLISTVVTPMLELGFLRTEDGEKLKQLAGMSNMRITMDTDNIEQLIWTLQDLNMSSNLQIEREK